MEVSRTTLADRWTKSPTFRPNVRAIPIVVENMIVVPAGVIDVGVEDRRLTSEIVDAHLATMGMSKKEDLKEDAGPSVHVLDADTGFEHLRFDFFPRQPHYHYFVPDLDGVSVMWFDLAANGSMIEWVCDTLPRRMRPMLEKAGFARAELLDDRLIASAMGEVKRLLNQPSRRVVEHESS